MKKFKFLLLFLLCVSTSLIYSQTHMTFKNIPIDGKADNFAMELAKTGFEIIESKDNVVILNGKFMTYDCEVFVMGTSKTNTTWKVIAYLPKITNWYNIKSKYFDIKKQFDQKYGEGMSYEFFTSPYYEGDGYEMQALALEKCTYTTYYPTSLGYISVSISKFEQICITYEDGANLLVKEREQQSIITNDI